MGKIRADYWRQLDFYEPQRDKNSVLIIGAGATGSYVCFGLARMGVRDITICDHDTVEAHNLPNQFFPESLATEEKVPKVLMLQKAMEFMVPNASIRYEPFKVEVSEYIAQRSFNVVIVAVDDMEVRKWIWERFKNSANLIIDPRTGGQYFNVFSIVTGIEDARKYYDSKMYANSEVSPLPCTGTAVMDVSLAVSAEVIQRYRLWFKKKVQYIMHSFHDFSNGFSGVMATYQKEATEGTERVFNATEGVNGHDED